MNRPAHAETSPLRIRPTHDWIVARKTASPKPDDLAKVGGIFTPQTRSSAPPHHFALVVDIGPGRAHPQTGFAPPPPCAVGDTIMVRSVAGDPETVDEVEYHWFMPDEVLAVVPAAA